jgi:hypothetical protein
MLVPLTEEEAQWSSLNTAIILRGVAHERAPQLRTAGWTTFGNAIQEFTCCAWRVIQINLGFGLWGFALRKAKIARELCSPLGSGFADCYGILPFWCQKTGPQWLIVDVPERANMPCWS